MRWWFHSSKSPKQSCFGIDKLLKLFFQLITRPRSVLGLGTWLECKEPVSMWPWMSELGRADGRRLESLAIGDDTSHRVCFDPIRFLSSPKWSIPLLSWITFVGKFVGASSFALWFPWRYENKFWLTLPVILPLFRVGFMALLRWTSV